MGQSLRHRPALLRVAGEGWRWDQCVPSLESVNDSTSAVHSGHCCPQMPMTVTLPVEAQRAQSPLPPSAGMSPLSSRPGGWAALPHVCVSKKLERVCSFWRSDAHDEGLFVFLGFGQTGTTDTLRSLTKRTNRISFFVFSQQGGNFTAVARCRKCLVAPDPGVSGHTAASPSTTLHQSPFLGRYSSTAWGGGGLWAQQLAT